MASRDPTRPPPKPCKLKPIKFYTRQELEQVENARRRLFSPSTSQDSESSLSPEPIPLALDAAQDHYGFNSRTRRPIAGRRVNLSRSPPLPAVNPTLVQTIRPVSRPPSRFGNHSPSRPHSQTGGTTYADIARGRAGENQSRVTFPTMRNRHRSLINRPSTARPFYTVDDPPIPRPPTRRGFGLAEGQPLPLRPLSAPWIMPQPRDRQTSRPAEDNSNMDNN